MEDLSMLNWLAVIVGTVVSFLAGWLWYSPKLFGVKWAEGSKVSMNDGSSFPVFAMGSQLVALFLLALVVGMTEIVTALYAGILIILTVAVFAASLAGFSQKSSYAIAVDFFYIIVAGVIMITSQGIF
ncbi:MAG: general stress protein CsbA [Cellvibrionaceae bacterium]|jgi:general stress protein CsbA